jgi:hypothetical protein
MPNLTIQPAASHAFNASNANGKRVAQHRQHNLPSSDMFYGNTTGAPAARQTSRGFSPVATGLAGLAMGALAWLGMPSSAVASEVEPAPPSVEEVQALSAKKEPPVSIVTSDNGRPPMFLQTLRETLATKGLVIPKATDNSVLQAEVPNLGGRATGNTTLSLRYNKAGNLELTVKTPVIKETSLSSLQNLAGLKPSQVKEWYATLSSSLVQQFQLTPNTVNPIGAGKTFMEQQTAGVVEINKALQWQIGSNVKPLQNNSTMATNPAAVAASYFFRLNQASDTWKQVPLVGH